MPTYAGINGVVRKLKEWPVGVGGAVRQQKEVWAGVEGVNRKIFSAKKQYTITLTGNWVNPASPWVTIGSVVINGSSYSGAQTVLADENSTITAKNLGDTSYGWILYNGNRVSNTTYSFIANKNYTINCTPNSSGYGGYGAIISITPN